MVTKAEMRFIERYQSRCPTKRGNLRIPVPSAFSANIIIERDSKILDDLKRPDSKEFENFESPACVVERPFNFVCIDLKRGKQLVFRAVPRIEGGTLGLYKGILRFDDS
jgi:hypothetical protein